jgi:hypothetical protein
MNTTGNTTENCKTFLFSTDPFEVALNVFRILIPTLYIAWLLFAFCFKEMRNRQMAFLINLNAVGLMYSSTGIVFFFHDKCSIPTVQVCIAMSAIALFIYYYSGYAISALAMHRMLCCYLINIKTQLKCGVITIALLVTWLLPVSLALIHQFGFKSITYYSQKEVLCLYDPLGDVSSIIFLSIFSALIPNVLILTSYIMLVLKLRQMKLKSSNKTSVSLVSLEPPRITIQLIIYIISFEFNCITNIIDVYRYTLVDTIISREVSRWFRIFRWLQHICPLGLLYFHPVLIGKYKRFLKSLRN